MITRAVIEDDLRAAGARADAELDIAEIALGLAMLDRPGDDIAPYRDHLAELDRAVAANIPPAAAHSVQRRVRALSRTIADEHGYAGDTLTYDDPGNASLTRVIDRRRGIPVALAIIYLHVARAQGWDAWGLGFPGHFLIRLERGAARAIVDPFNGGVERDVSELRDLLKQMAGMDAELRPDHYAPVGNRDTLIRLLNNIKIRALAAGDAERAAEIIERCLMFAPDRIELLAEIGACHARTGNLRRATEALESYLERCDGGAERGEAERLLHRLRTRLN